MKTHHHFNKERYCEAYNNMSMNSCLFKTLCTLCTENFVVSFRRIGNLKQIPRYFYETVQRLKIWRVWYIFHNGHVSGAMRKHFFSYKNSKPSSWLITIMKGLPTVLLRYDTVSKVNNICTLEQIHLLENKKQDLSLTECLLPHPSTPASILFSPFTPTHTPWPSPGHKSYPSKRANPEAKPAFNLSLIVGASNLRPMCVISFYWLFIFN